MRGVARTRGALHRGAASRRPVGALLPAGSSSRGHRSAAFRARRLPGSGAGLRGAVLGGAAADQFRGGGQLAGGGVRLDPRPRADHPDDLIISRTRVPVIRPGRRAGQPGQHRTARHRIQREPGPESGSRAGMLARERRRRPGLPRPAAAGRRADRPPPAIKDPPGRVRPVPGLRRRDLPGLRDRRVQLLPIGRILQVRIGRLVLVLPRRRDRGPLVVIQPVGAGVGKGHVQGWGRSCREGNLAGRDASLRGRCVIGPPGSPRLRLTGRTRGQRLPFPRLGGVPGGILVSPWPVSRFRGHEPPPVQVIDLEFRLLNSCEHNIYNQA